MQMICWRTLRPWLGCEQLRPCSSRKPRNEPPKSKKSPRPPDHMGGQRALVMRRIICWSGGDCEIALAFLGCVTATQKGYCLLRFWTSRQPTKPGWGCPDCGNCKLTLHLYNLCCHSVFVTFTIFLWMLVNDICSVHACICFRVPISKRNTRSCRPAVATLAGPGAVKLGKFETCRNLSMQRASRLPADRH